MVDVGKVVWVQAPDGGGRTMSGGVGGVRVAPDEEVEWVWAHNPDGTSHVVGYNLRKKAKVLDKAWRRDGRVI